MGLFSLDKQKKIEWLKNAAAKFGNQTAIITPNRSYNYNELYKGVNKSACVLSQFGLRKNDRTALLAPNSFNFIKWLLAVWEIGAIPVPINIRLSNHEIKKQLDFILPKIVFVYKNIKSKDSLKKHFQTLNFPFYRSLKKTEKLYNVSSKNDTSLIMSTSGSSDNPKAVEFSFECLESSVKNTLKFAKSEVSDLWLASLPFYHIGGLQIILRSLISGGTLVIPNSLKTDDLIDSVFKYSPHYISLVPTMLKRFVEKKHFLPKTKNIFIGGAALPRFLEKLALDENLPITKVYGSTETSSMITSADLSEIKKQPGTSGKPLGNNKIFIVGKKGDHLSAGRTGEIVVKSNGLAKGYYNNYTLTKDKFSKNSYRTGDSGYLNKEGYLFVKNRREDLIISGGENINPSEVEEALLETNKAEDVFVFGESDKEWGAIIKAAVVLKKGVRKTEKEILNELKKRIASYKCPKEIIILNSIPKNDLGKVNRKKLMRLIRTN